MPCSYEREVRDLPWSEYRTTVVIELYRVRCPDCGVKTEKVPQLPSKAPFSKRFEEAVGLACESAAGRRVARQFGLASSTVRAIDVRYLRRWPGRGRRCGDGVVVLCNSTPGWVASDTGRIFPVSASMPSARIYWSSVI